jgi:hypothetical protein
MEGGEQAFEALGDEDAGDTDAGSECFLKEIGALNTRKDGACRGGALKDRTGKDKPTS